MHKNHGLLADYNNHHKQHSCWLHMHDAGTSAKQT
jgi:hypothetical protein